MRILTMILTIFTFASSFPVVGQREDIRRPFSEFGYPRQTIVYGQQNPVVFFVKNDPLRNLSKSGFYLEIVLSPLIDKTKSKLTVRVSDWPMLVFPLKDQQDTIQVFVPMLKTLDDSGFTKLSVEPNLWYQDQDCMDIDQQSVWLNITENSYFKDAILPPPSQKTSWTIGDFLPSAQKILISKKNFQQFSGTLVRLHYYMQAKHGKNIAIQYLEESTPIDYYHAIIIGKPADVVSAVNKKFTTDDFPKKPGIHLHVFEQLDSLNSNKIFYNTLVVGSNEPESIEKTIEALFASVGESFTLGNSFNLIERSIKPTEYHFSTKNTYSLRDLGLDDEMITGIGRIRKNVTLPDYIGKPSLNTFSMRVALVHKPVLEGEQAYANIFFNNKLVQTYRLDETGRLDKKIMATKAQLGAGNYIGFEIIYIPREGLCYPDSFDFYAQLLPDESLVEFQYHRDIAQSIHSFPANFQGKQIQLVHDFDLGIADIPDLSRILALINTRDVKNLGFYLPEILHLQHQQSLIQKDAHLILLSKSRNNWKEITTIDGPIIFDDEQIIYRSDELENFFKFHSGSPLNYVQFFNRGSRKFLQFNLLSNQKAGFERLLDGFNDNFLTNTGNVMVANNSRYFFFDLKDRELKNQKSENIKKFEEFWDSYRILIISILLISVVVLLLYIFKKSRIAQKSIEDARK
jgi:hypothetical protein